MNTINHVYDASDIWNKGDAPMTVCIAVACQDNKAVVVASDKMLSVNAPNMEIEHALSKIDMLSEHTLAMTAGSALIHTELFRDLKEQNDGSMSTADIAEKLKDLFVAKRNDTANTQIMKPRGLSLAGFYSSTTDFQPEFVMAVDREVKRLKIPLWILLAGVDDDGAHIFRIHDPGECVCFDRIGFHAIGSGDVHASLTLMGSKVSPAMGLKRAVYLTYESKRRAEVAKGVGKETDMAIITATGIHLVTDQEFDALEKTYQARIKPEDESVLKAIEELPFEE